MGKGDKKTRRGKISMGTYGRLRKRKTPVQLPAKKKGQEKITKALL